MWFGWSGEQADATGAEIHEHRSGNATIATIDLSERDIDEYYNGYANSTLWPLFHYRIDLAQFEERTGRGYERVNECFADSLKKLIDGNDLLWVHDYHLIPVGQRLRERGANNRMGFFLHTPWPPTRLLTSLPFHERLVTSLLAYDLIGFQTEEWLSSFVHYCESELGAQVDEDSGSISYNGRETIARAYPIGIDWDHFQKQGESEDARASEQRLLASTRDRIAMIGVDRLDYSKGLPERIDGIGRFFDQHPDRARDLVFIQIAPPSREDVDSYQLIRETLEQKTGQINGARSEVDIVPIRYVNHGYSHAELYGFFRAAKIGLVTPLRDGMNLVAKEYVAAQDPDDPGVLILSEFAGAAHQLGCDGEGAVLVNPHSPDVIASAIQQALDMKIDERSRRYRNMVRSVREETVTGWTDGFCRDLAGLVMPLQV